MKKQLILFVLLYLTCITSFAVSFDTYQNARFNYKIDYPTFLIPQGESANSDGQVIKNRNATLTVWGSYSPSSIDEAYNNATDDLKDFNVTYSVKKNNYFVISGENATQIAYHKTIFVCDENINMELLYPKQDKDKWNSIVDRISQSFDYASGDCRK